MTGSRPPGKQPGKQPGRQPGRGGGKGRPPAPGPASGRGRAAGRGGPPASRGKAAPGGSGGRAPGATGRPDGRGRGRRTDVPPHRVAPAAKGLGGEQVEGRQAVRELLIAGSRKVREIWVSAELEGSDAIDDILELADDQRVPIQRVSRTKLESEARSEAPQGILAKAAPLPEASFENLIKRRGTRPPFLVAVDGVTDPGNLGALLRSAEGAGVDGVVLPRHRAVHVTPTVAKAAAGAIEHVPMAIVGGLPTALESMRKAGVWVVGLDDAADRTLFELGDLAREAICLVLGAEGTGLSRLVRERCDVIVSIPMRGRLSSLNVSVSAALACYEVTRERLRPADTA